MASTLTILSVLSTMANIRFLPMMLAYIFPRCAYVPGPGLCGPSSPSLCPGRTTSIFRTRGLTFFVCIRDIKTVRSSVQQLLQIKPRLFLEDGFNGDIKNLLTAEARIRFPGFLYVQFELATNPGLRHFTSSNSRPYKNHCGFHQWSHHANETMWSVKFNPSASVRTPLRPPPPSYALT